MTEFDFRGDIVILVPSFSRWSLRKLILITHGLESFDRVWKVILDFKGTIVILVTTFSRWSLRKPIAVEAEYQMRGHGCKMFVVVKSKRRPSQYQVKERIGQITQKLCTKYEFCQQAVK